MATTTTIVMGRPEDGETSTTTGSLAYKINQLTTGAGIGNFALGCSKLGSKIVVVIVK